MAEANEVVDVEKEARALGWSSKEEWRGRPTDWVDAETFVEKGKHILPIVNERNQTLQREVSELRSQITGLAGVVKAADATIKALEESHEADTAAQVEQARKDLKAELKIARADGDNVAAAELAEKLDDLNEAARAAPPAKKDEGTQTPPAEHPEFTAWKAKPENSWFGVDRRRTALAIGVAEDFRAGGDTRTGAAFMDAVVAEVKKTLGEGAPPGGKVEGGTHRSDGAGGSKSYADLPAEAKAACDKQAAKLVGPGRAHKDAASWRASYAKQFFAME